VHTEQFTRAVARPASLWHQPDLERLTGGLLADSGCANGLRPP